MFEPKNEVNEVALNILKKRYFSDGETSWDDVVNRVMNFLFESSEEDFEITKQMFLNRYFIPNSPCLVNAGKRNGGLSACFVVDFPDTIEGIYQTKLDFALIAKKGGGCGTTLSKLRPENSSVEGSTHGYAGGPVKFFDTICHDMKAMTQAGFREMAMMGTMSVYHPDIVKFITAKTEEGKMTTTNISVVVDNDFMKKVKNEEEYTTFFDYPTGRDYGHTYPAREIFNMIVEGAWKNGEPGLIFYDSVNDSPYKYSKQEILATNPCGEQGLPFNGVCNLGSLDISKFLNVDKSINLEKLETAVRLSVRFLDRVITKNQFPTKAIKKWAEENRPVGLGIMGLADYYLIREVAYGSDQALEELEFILNFIYQIAEDESIELGELYGVPKACKKLPVPRRNITLLSIAPTGTISLLAGCNSGIEPVFSEITNRSDKTGTYSFDNESSSLPYFRCAVSTNGGKEVTWEEHVRTQAAAQKFVDSGVSKTINFPNHTHRETVGNAFMLAWELGCKGITVYRNGSRQMEVLSPKNLKKDKCPLCDSELIKESGCTKCINADCGFSLCEVG
jgi:ribonucleoside-diphosphate reductase alpha chain